MEKELEEKYFADLQKIKNTIYENRNKAMVVVNSAMIVTYYQIGELINLRNKWGTKYVHFLATNLKEFGHGYSFGQLMKMAQFAKLFTRDEILTQPVTKIPWGTLSRVIIAKSSSKEEMLWYINKTYEKRWSRSIVSKQFELEAYKRNLNKPITTDNKLIHDIIKDTLTFEFISNKEVTSEKELKNKLIDNVILFLQELGEGFAFVGKEYRLVTPTNKNFYIDLLLYHTKIHSYIVLEVKLDEVSPSDFGQLNFYVNAINDLEKTDSDNETVGILLCKKADKYVVKTSIEGLKNPLGVSKYKLLEELPLYLSSKLNELD